MSSAEERRNWRRTARGRLRFELAGIAFARAQGKRPEDWAAHLWSHGAQRWLGDATPAANEYLDHEVEAFGALYPEVRLERAEWTATRAELRFTRGCLGGWGRDRWSIARALGLEPDDIGRYCAEAFRLWGAQLGLSVEHRFDAEHLCTLVARCPVAGADQPDERTT